MFLDINYNHTDAYILTNNQHLFTEKSFIINQIIIPLRGF